MNAKPKSKVFHLVAERVEDMWVMTPAASRGKTVPLSRGVTELCLSRTTYDCC